jgi:hypothetical protein
MAIIRMVGAMFVVVVELEKVVGVHEGRVGGGQGRRNESQRVWIKTVGRRGGQELAQESYYMSYVIPPLYFPYRPSFFRANRKQLFISFPRDRHSTASNSNRKLRWPTIRARVRF